jgi:hypothetical protein
LGGGGNRSLGGAGGINGGGQGGGQDGISWGGAGGGGGYFGGGGSDGGFNFRGAGGGGGSSFLTGTATQTLGGGVGALPGGASDPDWSNEAGYGDTGGIGGRPGRLLLIFDTPSALPASTTWQMSGTNVFYLAGSIGVATSDPAASVHVNGEMLVNGNVAAKYQDVAEWVDAAEALAAGTVVRIDPDHNNRVRRTEQAYDSGIAGVVSSQPGVLLGVAGVGKVAVAQSGRVKVKVDARYGAIRPGDLLVASPRAGYAMRSEPVTTNGIALHRTGTIIGKALEPLTSGEGEILVLVTLQ